MATADSYGLFWNSDSGDRKYNADSFERWLRKFFTSGVFEGDLQVLASSGMTVNVQTGYCNLFGKVGLFEVVNSITLDAANSRYPRIDTIVVERNDTDRIIYLKKVNGSYSGDNPQPTAPIWDETQGVYQLVLAQIYIGAGVSSITQSNITDTRTDSNLCGYITGTVEEIDFAQITAQFEQYFAEFEQSNLEEFEAWFERMKDQLSEDAAGHLQNEIDGTQNEIDGIQDNIGDLSNLETEDKSNLVAAINEEATEIATMNNVLGAKNLLPNNATSQVISGVTFTVNSDGSITADGTATLAFLLNIKNRGAGLVPRDGEYILSGLSEYTEIGYGLVVYDNTTRENALWLASGEAHSRGNLYAEHEYTVAWYFTQGKTVSNVMLYPMIRPASIKDDTYVPYAMTNKELTDSIKGAYKVADISVTTDGVRNYRTLLNSLFAQIDFNRINFNSKLVQYRAQGGMSVYPLTSYEKGVSANFGAIFYPASDNTSIFSVYLHLSNSTRTFIRYVNGSISGGSETNSVISAGLTIGILY